MGKFCAVYGCSNRSNREKNRRFYSIPAIIKHCDKKTKVLSQGRRDKWLTVIKRKDLTEEKIRNASVCSDHFISGYSAVLYNPTNPDWVPTLKMGYRDQSTPSGVKGHQRAPQRNSKKKQLQDNVSDAEDSTTSIAMPSESHAVTTDLREPDDVHPDESDRAHGISTKTDMYMMIAANEGLNADNCMLREEVRLLKGRLKRSDLDEDSFKDDSGKVSNTVYHAPKMLVMMPLDATNVSTGSITQ